MNRVLSQRGIAGASLGFMLLLIYALLNEQWLILAIPFIFGIVLFAFFKPKYLLFALVAITPFSINLEDLGLGDSALYLPTEPLLFGLTILLVLAHLADRVFLEEVMHHPISIALYIYLGWMLVTAFTSTDVVVSLKYLISRLWFVIPIYFGGATLFIKERNAQHFVLLYLISFLAVVVFTLIKHAGMGFEEDPAHSVMDPFYRDHTQYGAVVAFFIPITFGFLVQTNRSIQWRVFNFIALTILSIALVYTYARAAWLSVFLAAGIVLLVKLRIRLWMLIAGGLSIFVLFLFTFDDIIIQLQKNKTDSSENLLENVESITNITTDASNLERINRWNSVLAMAKERPVFGFGPGTYAFEYAPYQQSKDLTIISTNFGDVGNAHSEYLGPLAESGIPGFLSMIYLVVVLFYISYRSYHRLPEGRSRQMLLYTSLALLTYFAHGTLNNYLDSDKASVPIFGFMAIVVALDIVAQRRQQTNKVRK
ncbi:MAG: hypothetical protein HKN87_06235 [Saprospiraceae bacterium]|nr:hypothetical protein [Saprospiraceae bacterium]